MDNVFETVLRGLFVVCGLVLAGHHLAAAAAMKRAPHLVKAFSLPLTTMSGVGMAVLAVIYGSGAALWACFPAIVGTLITELRMWQAGAYISAAFEREAEVRECARRRLNIFINDAMAAQEMGDILTQSGQEEMRRHEKPKAAH